MHLSGSLLVMSGSRKEVVPTEVIMASKGDR